MWRVSLGNSLRKDKDPVNHIILTTISNKSSGIGLNNLHPITTRLSAAHQLRLWLKAVSFTPQDLTEAVAEHFISISIIFIFIIRGKEGQLSASKIWTVSPLPTPPTYSELPFTLVKDTAQKNVCGLWARWEEYSTFHIPLLLTI